MPDRVAERQALPRGLTTMRQLSVANQSRSSISPVGSSDPLGAYPEGSYLAGTNTVTGELTSSCGCGARRTEIW